jgi:nitroimidazol reductase NimA-like FMN-containing flavoprotein (pyridoxamine 5'-phosphate oxidase superfamily)
MKNISRLIQEVKSLCASQQLCVLATQSEGQPYSNLVAFAETDELRSLIFVTNRNTRKYTNAVSNDKVAMMIDSRTNRPSDFNTALAVTALGTIEEVSGFEHDAIVQKYLSKHPYLKEFANMPDQALMRVKVTEYVIAHFDRVRIIHIGDLG